MHPLVYMKHIFTTLKPAHLQFIEKTFKISYDAKSIDLARELVGQDTHSLMTPYTSQSDKSISPEPEQERSGKRKRCYVQKCSNKTNKSCINCKKPLCAYCNVNKELKYQQCA
ncbi:hypothetical protein WA026_020750 [Henosepilachna vigintioctopunctata]|uniref:Uncharacterized protein n=1 Tax=Henosepilachna vigintioctopunctata TaxID=420089 RepID=A0AAW1UBL6_9CUCU